MSAAEPDCLCLVCDVAVDSLPPEQPFDRRCMDCRLRGRTASFRLRFELGKVSHRTCWCDDFEVVESLREYYVSHGIGSNHRLERRITEGDSE